MAKERGSGGAQDECHDFLNRYGWGKKNIDGVVCPRCFYEIVPKKGEADYLGAVNGHMIAVEVKGGTDRLPFYSISKEQWEWLEWFEQVSGTTGWFWLQMGYHIRHKVFPRSVFLITRKELVELREEANSYGVDNLPLNEYAARTRIKTRENGYHATGRCFGSALVWNPGRDGQRGFWTAGGDHPFVQHYVGRPGAAGTPVHASGTLSPHPAPIGQEPGPGLEVIDPHRSRHPGGTPGPLVLGDSQD